MNEAQEYRIKGRDSTIFRVRKSPDNPYVMIDRRPIDNPRLSYKAKGILSYLLSRPDGWEVNVPDLVNHGTDGAASIRSGLKELRDCGHVRYNPEREGGFIRRWVIEVYEVPEIVAQSDEGEKVLDDDFLQVGNLQVGNRREVLSTLSINELKPLAQKKAPKANQLLATMPLDWQIASGVEKITMPTVEDLAAAQLTDDVNMFAPNYQPFVKQFIEATCIHPLKSDVASWQAALMYTFQRGVTLDDFRSALEKMQKDNLMIVDPHSVKTVAQAIRGEREKRDSQNRVNQARTPVIANALANFRPRTT